MAEKFVTVMLRGGLREKRRAYESELGLVITNDGWGWGITHLKSGCHIGTFPSRARARLALKTVAPLFRWGLGGVEARLTMQAEGTSDFFRLLLEDLGSEAPGEFASDEDIRRFEGRQ